MMKRTIFAALTIGLLLSLAAPAFAENAIKHTMEKGETLYSIARKYKVSYEALASANGITDPTKVKTGTVLVIPSVHVVAKGETLFGLARQYGVSVSELLAANKLSANYVLKVGDSLVIPGGSNGEASPKPQPLSIPSTSAAKSAAPTTTVASAKSSTSSSLKPAGSTSLTEPEKSGEKSAEKIAKSGSSTSQTTVGAPVGTSKSSGTTSTSVPMPPPVKVQDKAVDMKLDWPAAGKAMYLDGKLEGIMIRVKPGETAKAIAAGTVVSAGPSRGFSQVAFVQAKTGYVYVYGGNDSLFVKTGDQVASGKEIGKIGVDSKDGSPIAYFFVFRNGQPIDPALAPRD